MRVYRRYQHATIQSSEEANLRRVRVKTNAGAEIYDCWLAEKFGRPQLDSWLWLYRKEGDQIPQ